MARLPNQIGVRLTKLSWATTVVSCKQKLQKSALNKLEDKNMNKGLGIKQKM